MSLSPKCSSRGFAVVIASILAACGGGNSTSADLFNPATGEGGVGGGTDASVSAADGATLSDGSTRNVTLSDGSTRSGGSSSDAGPGGSPQTLACGATTCAIPAESCCVYDTATPTYNCAGGACPTIADGGSSTPTSLKCSASANCAAGTVCCVHTAGNQAASECSAACGSNQAQLCDPNAPLSGCLAVAGGCSAKNVSDWGLPPTYATCGGVGN